MTLTILDVEQGSGDWDDARRGIITASVMHNLITAKTIKPAANVDSRAITMILAAERINGWTDDNYVTFDMARGHEIEPEARRIYSEHYAPVTECGFMVREIDGTKIGYSPDGLVGEDGLIETKSRRPKEHLSAILANAVPGENMAQLQTGLLVSGRAWIDYLSWCGGMKLWKKRIYPDQKWQDAILYAALDAEVAIETIIDRYHSGTAGMPLTERAPALEEMTY